MSSANKYACHMVEIEVLTRKNEALSEYGFFILISDFFGHLTFLILAPR